jgi:5'(3')-deoxyribonucleotidase
MVTKRRFLIDADQVLVDLFSPVLQRVSEIRGVVTKIEDFHQWDLFLDLSPEENQVVRELMTSKGFVLSLKVLPGAQEAVEELKKKTDLFVVTAPYDASPYWVYERYQWLERFLGIPKDKVVVTHSKFTVSGAFLLDDNPHNILEWEKEHPYSCPMIWDYPHTRNECSEKFRVSSWGEVLAEVDLRG